MAALDADHDIGQGRHPAAALVEAATELLAVEPPSAVSGRRIATAAGVNYAQIHRHFGAKRELCRHVLDRHRSRHGEPTASERCRYLLVAAAQLAWSLFEPLFATALGRNPSELEPQAATVLARMLNFGEHRAP